MSDLLYDDQSFGKPDWHKYAVHSDTEVKGFFGPYRALSNFAPSRVMLDNVWYPSVEAAYQAAKYVPENRKFFETCTGYDAKKRTKQIPPDMYTGEEWDRIKTDIMKGLLYQKFNRDINPEMYKFLMETVGDRYIEETNWWNDTFWGVCNGKGQNVLGYTIMEIYKSNKRWEE